MTAHENLSRTQEIEGSSDRSFGFVFAGALIVIACWPLLHGEAPRGWALVAAVTFGVIAQLRPTALARLNRLWIRLGVLLGKLVSPIMLAILFYGVMTPIGAVMRLAGKDPLRLKRSAGARSHWLPRKPPGPPPDSMTHQF
jgi:saxitoxin biosynthesis operon SxtJ-like protein